VFDYCWNKGNAIALASVCPGGPGPTWKLEEGSWSLTACEWRLMRFSTNAEKMEKGDAL